MEEINDLIAKLENVSAPVTKKVNGITNLKTKLDNAKLEYEKNPTPEGQADIEEIESFIADSKEEVLEILNGLLQSKIAREEKEAKRKKALAEAEEEARLKKEKEEKEKQQDKKPEESPDPDKKTATDPKTETVPEKTEEEKKKEKEEEDKKNKEKSGFGLGALLFGTALLVLSAGAINYFNKR